MHTVKNGLIEAKTGEAVRITFTVTDASGAAVAVEDAMASFRIARRAGEAALLTVTDGDGIALAGNTAVVTFDTGDLAEEGNPLLGGFFWQLTVTKDDDSLVVAEGPLHVGPVIF